MWFTAREETFYLVSLDDTEANELKKYKISKLIAHQALVRKHLEEASDSLSS